MGMPEPVTDWTAEWTHDYAVSALSRRIGSYVDAQGFGVLLFAPADISSTRIPWCSQTFS